MPRAPKNFKKKIKKGVDKTDKVKYNKVTKLREETKMKSTGIVRRIDDLGRVAIPKEIRRMARIQEGDALEILYEGNAICLKKYAVSEEEFAQKCADWVHEHKKEILSVNLIDNTTTVMFNQDGRVRIFSVKLSPQDKFDMNVAICYAAKKCGFLMFDGFRD